MIEWGETRVAWMAGSSPARTQGLHLPQVRHLRRHDGVFVINQGPALALELGGSIIG